VSPDVVESLRAWARQVRGHGRDPGHAITRAEHDAMTANATRPLTQSPIMRHHRATDLERGEPL
jgi:hypothetical protein